MGHQESVSGHYLLLCHLYLHISLSWTHIKTCQYSSSFNFHVLTIHHGLLSLSYTFIISLSWTQNKTHSSSFGFIFQVLTATSDFYYFHVLSSLLTVHYSHGLNNPLQCALSEPFTFKTMPKSLILHPFNPTGRQQKLCVNLGSIIFQIMVRSQTSKGCIYKVKISD